MFSVLSVLLVDTENSGHIIGALTYTKIHYIECSYLYYSILSLFLSFPVIMQDNVVATCSQQLHLDELKQPALMLNGKVCSCKIWKYDSALLH